MKQQRVDPGWAWTKKLNISAGVKVGDTVYLSGTVAFDSAGNVVGAGSVYEQSKQVFINIEEALASTGASMADVIKISTFLTDISGYGEFGRARTEAFPKGVPASAAYETSALIKPELLVEVEAIAVIGSGGYRHPVAFRKDGYSAPIECAGKTDATLTGQIVPEHRRSSKLELSAQMPNDGCWLDSVLKTRRLPRPDNSGQWKSAAYRTCTGALPHNRVYAELERTARYRRRMREPE